MQLVAVQSVRCEQTREGTCAGLSSENVMLGAGNCESCFAGVADGLSIGDTVFAFYDRQKHRPRSV